MQNYWYALCLNFRSDQKIDTYASWDVVHTLILGTPWSLGSWIMFPGIMTLRLGNTGYLCTSRTWRASNQPLRISAHHVTKVTNYLESWTSKQYVGRLRNVGGMNVVVIRIRRGVVTFQQRQVDDKRRRNYLQHPDCIHILQTWTRR